MTVKKDVQCYITVEAKAILDKRVKEKKETFGAGIHSRDVLSDMIITYAMLESEMEDSVFDKAEDLTEDAIDFFKKLLD
tara:strand:+ start:629 stop:865 length:237 start_codon:yes stop_codon:yes gene_type:complete